MVFVFLCLISFLLYDSLQVHPCCCKGIISFFFMAEQYSIVYLCHIVSIHSSAEGCLGCFHILAIVDSVACIILKVFFLDVKPRSGISGSYGNSGFPFHTIFHSGYTWCILFFIMAEPVSIPTKSVGGLLFGTTLSHMYYL